jgi:ABC-type lipoprotein export system ATPase subunit
MDKTSPVKVPALAMRGVAIAAMRDPAIKVAADVNWTVNAGEFWVVGAPQHSGKSDFLMTAGGITWPAAGEYLLLGERMPIFEEAQMAHRRLGFVFDGGLTVAGIALPP